MESVGWHTAVPTCQIAAELVVSEETIKTHVGNILSKLHMAQRTQAVVAALKRGLISLDDIDL